MARPPKQRIVHYHPRVTLYKPQGIPRRFLQTVILTVDQLEALRLADHEGASHEEAAARLDVSRATFGRIVEAARKSVAEALLQGKAIVIQGGTYAMAAERAFYCPRCRCEHKSRKGEVDKVRCPHESRKRQKKGPQAATRNHIRKPE
ncbi:MAG: DUF134 domain-containing protein [Bacteroidota bacterium]